MKTLKELKFCVIEPDKKWGESDYFAMRTLFREEDLRQEAIERIKFLERKYPEIKEEKLTFWLDGRKKEINCNIRNSDFIDRIGASAVRQYLMKFFNITEEDLR